MISVCFTKRIDERNHGLKLKYSKLHIETFHYFSADRRDLIEEIERELGRYEFIKVKWNILEWENGGKNHFSIFKVNDITSYPKILFESYNILKIKAHGMLIIS